MLIQFTRNTPKPIPSIPKHSIWLLSSAYFVSFVPAIRVHSLFCHRFWFGAGTPLFIVYNTLSQYTMLSNESINFRNVAFCVRIYLYFFVYDEAAFFRIEWDAMSVFTGQQKSDNKNIWTASLIVSLQLLWKKMMCRQTVLSVCTCLIYFYVGICYADSADFFFQLHVRVFFEENNWNTEVVKMIVWFEFHYAQMYMFYANENVHVW